jgi:hypothetical protein
VGEATRNVQAVYNVMYGYEHVDTEFAVTKALEVRALQSRPVVKLEMKEFFTVDRHDEPSKKIV